MMPIEQKYQEFKLLFDAIALVSPKSDKSARPNTSMHAYRPSVRFQIIGLGHRSARWVCLRGAATCRRTTHLVG